MVWSNAQLVKGSNDVQLGVELCFCEAVQSYFNQEYGVLILDCDSIKFLVVYTKAQVAVGFFDEQDWGRDRRCASTDKTLFEVLIKKLLEGLEFFLGHVVKQADSGESSFMKDYLVVI